MSPTRKWIGDDGMIVLEANMLKHYVEDRLLIEVENLRIHKDDRIGLVGRNGSGKTTLLELLSGKTTPSSGTIVSQVQSELLPQLKNTNTTQSGGEITQHYINRSLAKKSEILFADEPTTNLDTAHIEKLEAQLTRWQGAIVIVSHDRMFLDSLCSIIWEISDGRVKEYKGNYTDYVAQKQLERNQHESAYEQYELKKKQLEAALELKEKKAERATKIPKKVSPSEAKITGSKPYYANKQKKLRKAAKAIEMRLERLEVVEKIRELPSIKMNLLNEETFKGRVVLRLNDVSGIIGQRTLWNPTSFEVNGGDKMAIIGPNGSGKTTLVKKIVSGEAGVTISPSARIGYFSQNLDVLDGDQSILDNVSETSKQNESLIRTVLARLHFFREDVFKKVNVLSGGERVKVTFAKLFVSDVNILILDEPTNFLDIEALEAFESLLHDYEGTVLLVSHDRHFTQNIATRILAIRDQDIQLFNGTLNEFTQYKPQQTRDAAKDEQLLLDTKISDVLSRLSIEPSDELEAEFEKLIAERNNR